MRNAFFRAIALTFFICVSAINYPFTNEPIDVVIPAIEKDLFTLDYVIEGIRKNGHNIRRIIVVSKNRLTDQAEWFDEGQYPFSKREVTQLIFKRDDHPRGGWYYQQLLKLYAPFVIPDISSNVLILDADAIFLKPVGFLNEKNGGLYGVAKEYNKAYFKHGMKLIPKFKKLNKYSGVTHHMLFQRPVLEDLFSRVAAPFWKTFCLAVDPNDFAGASEYELYFNFVFANTDQVTIRYLNFANVQELNFDDYGPYDYVACHSWGRQ